MTTPSTTGEARASTLWIMLLTLASVAMTFVFACATPFTALAALAATQMRQGDGLLLMVTAWAASQAIDLAVRHYPVSGWAIALGVAAVGAVLAGRAVATRIAGGEIVRVVAAYLVAMVAFKAVIALGGLCLGGGASAFQPHVLLRELVRNAAILAGLYALYQLLTRLGVPAADRRDLQAA